MKTRKILAPLFLATALLGATAPVLGNTAAAPLPVININTADVATLTALQGVGQAKAQAIVDYRAQHGPFKAPEQLTEVKGIGDALLDANRGRITVK